MNAFNFPVQVIRTDRKKTISLVIEGGSVKITAPESISDDRIRSLISKRSPWISKKLQEISEKPIPRPKEYVSGEAFPFLGKNYRLKVEKGGKPNVKMQNGYIVATVRESSINPHRAVQSLLKDWYKKQAVIRLGEKTARFAKVIGVNPKSVSIRNYKSRWGSCSSKGDITFNWKIIPAPHHIVDYVVIHELCHLLEHNHSPLYWKTVERYVPNWKDCRDWLKNNPITI